MPWRPNLTAELRFSTSKLAHTHWASVTELSVALTFDVQGQIQCQRTGTHWRPNLPSELRFSTSKSAQTQRKMSQYFRWPWPFTFKDKSRSNDGERARDQGYRSNCVFRRQKQRKHSGQVSQYFRWPWPMIFKLKLKVKGRGMRWRPTDRPNYTYFDGKISANSVDKCRSTFGDLDLCPSRWNSRSTDGERAGYQAFRPNCVFSMSKSAQTQWASVAVHLMTLSFHLQVQIKGQKTGNGLGTKFICWIAFFDVKISANAVGRWPSRSNWRPKDAERAGDQTYRPNAFFSTSKSAQRSE